MTSQTSGDEGNLLRRMMDQASDIDFREPDTDDSTANPNELMIEGFQIGKLFAIVEFALLHSQDEDSLLSGLNMMTRQQAIKAINGIFLFEVTNAEGSVAHFCVDMRKSGHIYLGKGNTKPKPDVTIRIADKDMVDLAMGKMNPQMAFLKGKIKVKGNIMLGLRCQQALQREVQKMSKL